MLKSLKAVSQTEFKLLNGNSVEDRQTDGQMVRLAEDNDESPRAISFLVSFYYNISHNLNNFLIFFCILYKKFSFI